MPLPSTPKGPLLRILGQALRFRGTCGGVLFCSVMVAVLWGGNIGGMYPVLQVVIAGESLQDWLRGQAAESQEEIERLTRRISEVDKQRNPTQQQLQEVARWKTRLDTEQAALASTQRLQPWVEGYLPNDPFRTLVVAIGALFAAVLVRQGFLILSSMLQARLNGLISLHLQQQFFVRVLQTDLATLGQIRPSGMMTHLKDTEKVSSGATLILESGIREPAKLIVCLVGASMISWRLLLFTLVLAPLAAITIRTLGRSIRRSSDLSFRIDRDLKRVLFDVLGGLPVVQLSTAEKREQARFHGYLVDSFRRKIKMAFYGSLSKATTEIFGLGTICVTLTASAYLVLNEQTHIFGIRMCDRPLSLASVFVFYGLLLGMNDPVRRFGGIFSGVQHSVAAANRLFPVLDQSPSIREAK